MADAPSPDAATASPQTGADRPRIEASRTPRGGLIGAILYPFRLLKVVYAWLLSLADTKWGPAALIGVGLLDTSIVPLPPDPLMLALCFGKRRYSFVFSNMLVATSIAGGCVLWLVGHHYFDSVVGWVINTLHWQGAWYGALASPETQKLTAEQIASLPRVGGEIAYPDGLLFQCKTALDDNAFLFYAGSALAPGPFRVACVTGGLFSVNLVQLVLGTLVGRGIRFNVPAALAFFFGPKIKPLLDRYFEWIALGAVALVVAAVMVLRYAVKA
ncbi:MAG: hypothetical protein IT462_16800 [Planctomycetes bacterium]|nr:hypothetical protein [Planctomycetota bacterium]